MSSSKTRASYLAVRTDRQGKRRWSLLLGSEAIIGDCASLCYVLWRARGMFGEVSLAVWDHDRGEFGPELRTGPGW